MVIGESLAGEPIVTFENTNDIDADTFITFTGDFKTTGAFIPIVLDSSLSGNIFVRNSTLVNDGTVPAISTDAATDVVIQNVVTNVELPQADTNINDLGQSIIRDINYK